MKTIKQITKGLKLWNLFEPSFGSRTSAGDFGWFKNISTTK